MDWNLACWGDEKWEELRDINEELELLELLDKEFDCWE